MFKVGKDKILHLMVGALMGLVFAFPRLIGLFVGWALIIGWEVYQAGTNTGTPEVADIIWGGIPFTIVWFIAFTLMRRRSNR